MTDQVETEIWRICEMKWAEHLESQNWQVDLVRPFRQDDPAGAPMIRLSIGREVRRPDIKATRAGHTEFWEVKYRTRADSNPITGIREFWMSREAFEDYYRLAIDRDVDVHVILRAEGDHLRSARWLLVTVRRLVACGHPDQKVAADGRNIEAWVWPESEMQIVPDGPSVIVDQQLRPVLPEEPERQMSKPPEFPPRVPIHELERAEETKRGIVAQGEVSARAQRVVADPMVALDVLRRRSDLRVPQLPKYSVLRISDRGINLESLLGLLDYGIRVFLITSQKMTEQQRKRYLPFIASRLLEWSHCPEDELPEFWAVDGLNDGKRFSDWPAPVAETLKRADDNGGINIGQFEVVHSPADADVVITAGAGTGKTETMSERIVFLLATSALLELRRDDHEYPFDLRLNDIVLVTFTREAAAQMRERLARVLNLRRRLCRDCVLAAVPWMLQLGGTQISTIHSYAQLVAQESAATIGLTPGLAVRSQTLDLRRILHRALSRRLVDLVDSAQKPDDVPASHEWLKHLEEVWKVLGSNGIEFLPIGISSTDLPTIDWGTDGSIDDRSKTVATVIRETIEEAAREFADLCVENGVLPVDQLVPSALRALLKTDEPRIGRPKFLFVDEFQDTDGKQMDLILAIRERLDARLFVVGDVKQGIYHFRGAEGSAFLELSARVKHQQQRAIIDGTPALPDLLPLSLVRNFRSGGVLLAHLDACFRVWGRTAANPQSANFLLDYKESDVLKAEVERFGEGSQIETQEILWSDFENRVVTQIRDWLRDADRDDKKIGILCRQNWIANKIRSALRSAHLPCEVIVGGQFFQSSAVHEARVLLDAITTPSNTAALLELCETRWFGGLASPQKPPSGRETDEFWEEDTKPILAWSDRLRGLADRTSNNVTSDDLEWLRTRLFSLRKLQSTMSPVALLAQCHQKFKPHQWARVNDTNDPARERQQYQLCLEHLLVLLDAQTESRPSTLPGLTDWLRLQIATNEKEDEPQPETLGRVTALTVHKAKGLEFDYVLIPNTWAPFESSNATSVVRVVRADPPSTTPKLLWTWRANNLANHDPSSPAAIRESEESRREETRLLYVAMTRARDRLMIFVRERRADDTWGELLKMVGL